MSASSPLRSDEQFMRRALALAARRKGWTSPNPCVGAVVVKRGRIVGEGIHPAWGQPHAEALALAAAGPRAQGATVYVNLEPCCHHGRTPPCTDALVAAGVKRVVAAMRDPNPKVNGGGFAALQRAGIECVSGVLQAPAEKLNEDFVKFVTTGRPFVTLKLAMSLDGRIATSSGESKWITGPRARALAHRLRHEHDAVMVGINTVRSDDPLLTCRLPGKHKQPHRIVVDSHARMSAKARCIDSALGTRTILATADRSDRRDTGLLECRGVEIIEAGRRYGRVDLRALTRWLGDSRITSVLIEGGGQLAGAALNEGIVDRVVFFLAPMIIGGGGKSSVSTLVSGGGVKKLSHAICLRNLTVRRAGVDLLCDGLVEYPTEGCWGYRDEDKND